jgi:hypothetical protein
MLTFNISWKRKRAQQYATCFVYKKQQVAEINIRVLTPAAARIVGLVGPT